MPDEDRRVAIASAAALLAATRKTKRDLSDAADHVINQATVELGRHDSSRKSTVYASVLSTAKKLAPALTAALVLSNRHIADVARGRLVAEFDAIGLQLRHSELFGIAEWLRDEGTFETAAGDSLAAQWRSQALARATIAVRREKSVAKALSDSRKAIQSRIDTTAITETTRAYEDSRASELKAALERDPKLSKALEDAGAYEEYCAMADACPECRSYDGERRPVGGDFIGHICPPLHPNCCCVIALVF